jgi:hypothetical protein
MGSGFKEKKAFSVMFVFIKDEGRDFHPLPLFLTYHHNVFVDKIEVVRSDCDRMITNFSVF